MARLAFNPASGKLELVAGSDSCKNASGGIPVGYTEANTFTDTTETEVLTYTSTNDDEKFTRFVGSADTFGLWRVYVGAISPANLKMIFRSSETSRNLDVMLENGIDLGTTGGILRITFRAERYRTKHLGASGDTFIRIEGSY